MKWLGTLEDWVNADLYLSNCGAHEYHQISQECAVVTNESHFAGSLCVGDRIAVKSQGGPSQNLYRKWTWFQSGCYIYIHVVYYSVIVCRYRTVQYGLFCLQSPFPMLIWSWKRLLCIPSRAVDHARYVHLYIPMCVCGAPYCAHATNDTRHLFVCMIVVHVCMLGDEKKYSQNSVHVN